MAKTDKEAAVDHEAENVQLREELRQRNDELTQAKATIEKLKAAMSGKKLVDMSDQVAFKAEWKTPGGEVMTKVVEFKNPTVALPDGKASKTSTVALTKLASGKELSEQEKADNPGLAVYTSQMAADLINKWAKIGAAVLREVQE